MTRIPFTKAAERTIVARSTDMMGKTWCEECRAECVTRADYEIDHIVPEGVQPANDNERTLTAADGKLLCLRCHERKTKRDVFEIAKTKRMEAKHRIVGRGPTGIARRFGVKQEPR